MYLKLLSALVIGTCLIACEKKDAGKDSKGSAPAVKVEEKKPAEPAKPAEQAAPTAPAAAPAAEPAKPEEKKA